MKWTVGTKIALGYGATLLILVAIGIITYRGTNTLTKTSDWVAHTQQVLGQLDDVIKTMVDCETGMRGYVIAGKDAFLEPYQTGASQVHHELDQLATLTADNPAQQQKLSQLRTLIDTELASFDEVIDLRKTQGLAPAQQWVSDGKGKQVMDNIRQVVADMKSVEEGLLTDRAAAAVTSAANTRWTIIGGTAGAFAIVVIAGFFITRSISVPLQQVTTMAKRIADRDLTGDDLTVSSRDEVADLITAFNTMRANLRDMTVQIRQATENVNSTAAEVLASTQQQAAAAKEQAATIQEITSTLEEVNQSGAQIGDRAKQVAASVETASETTQRGISATQQTSQTMEAVRDQVEEVAENVVGLSERTQTIGEIIATVSEISEQSNLLALNAGIEAASAGDQGGRFSVVAHEMKNLADRAKDCTVQVRTILGEIQKGINTSVMLTEEAVKRADSGKQQAHATEVTIRDVTQTNEQSISAFQQIVAGSNQQQIGVTQVTQGMQDIRQAVNQMATGTQQMEKAAANMNALSQQLHRVVEQYRV